VLRLACEQALRGIFLASEAGSRCGRHARRPSPGSTTGHDAEQARRAGASHPPHYEVSQPAARTEFARGRVGSPRAIGWRAVFFRRGAVTGRGIASARPARRSRARTSRGSQDRNRRTAVATTSFAGPPPELRIEASRPGASADRLRTRTPQAPRRRLSVSFATRVSKRRLSSRRVSASTCQGPRAVRAATPCPGTARSREPRRAEGSRRRRPGAGRHEGAGGRTRRSRRSSKRKAASTCSSQRGSALRRGRGRPLEDAALSVRVTSRSRAAHQLVLPYMRAEHSGKIVNVSSMGGRSRSRSDAWYHPRARARGGIRRAAP